MKWWNEWFIHTFEGDKSGLTFQEHAVDIVELSLEINLSSAR